MARLPKSSVGERKLPLPPIVANTLRECKLACPKGTGDLVLPTGTGRAEYHSNIVDRGLISGLDRGRSDDPGSRGGRQANEGQRVQRNRLSQIYRAACAQAFLRILVYQSES